MNMMRSKKGFNDISILMGIIFVFLFTAVIIPDVNSAFNQNADEFDSDAYHEGIQEQTRGTSDLNARIVLLNLMKLSLWDVGNTLNLPFWIDIFFTVMAITFVTVIARNIWIGGGG